MEARNILRIWISTLWCNPSETRKDASFTAPSTLTRFIELKLGKPLVFKVPGNFHISAHAFGSVLGNLFATLNMRNLDLSHKVNHISFGDERDIKNVKRFVFMIFF